MRNLLLLVFLCVAASACAIDDTPANREKEAVRYMEATPPAEMVKDISDRLAVNMPPESREQFKALIIKHLDMAAITNAMKAAMVKHFTAEELKALADFYGSPVGQSARKKFGLYSADTMPVIQAEILKAQEEAVKAQAEANRQNEDEAK